LLAQDIDVKVMGNGICTTKSWEASNCAVPLMHPWPAISAVVVSLACLVLTFWALAKVGGQQRIRVIEAKHIPADLINYVIPYVLSFMGLDFSSPTKLLGFGVFFLWVFWITDRSGQIIMNPILVAFGWRLYEIKYSYLQSADAFTGRVLSKVVIEPNGTYRQEQLQDVMIIHYQGQEG